MFVVHLVPLTELLEAYVLFRLLAGVTLTNKTDIDIYNTMLRHSPIKISFTFAS